VTDWKSPSIISTSGLSILHSVEYRPTSEGLKYRGTSTKEFEFSGNSIIIEIKFCKSKTGITSRKLSSYQADIDKIKKIQKIVAQNSNDRNKIHGIFVVFNKTNITCNEFQRFLEQNSKLDDI
jgi:hypothetical protein